MTELIELIGELSDYGNPDHGAFTGWNDTLVLIGLIVAVAFMFISVARNFPKASTHAT
ncbi:MAG: hypothetical protein ACXWTU_03555 [Methylotenera sp.]